MVLDMYYYYVLSNLYLGIAADGGISKIFKAIKEFFKEATSFFTSLLDMISNIFHSFVNGLSMLPWIYLFLEEAVGFLPTFLLTFFTATIMILILKWVLELI